MDASPADGTAPAAQPVTPSPSDIAPAPAGAPRSAPAAPRNIPTSSRYRRGDVWLVVGDPQCPAVGTELWSDRPAVIVSNNISSNRSGFVQVVYLTTSARKRSGPTHIDVGSPLGDHRSSMALCEQIHTVDVSRMRKRLGHIEPSLMREIDAAIVFSLSIEHREDFSLFKKWESYIKTHGIDMATEIEALASRTTDERVSSLTRALEIVAAERDSYRQLYENAPTLRETLEEVRTAMRA